MNFVKKGVEMMWVTYQREIKVKAELDRLGIENFVPMRYNVVDGDTDNPHRELVPAIARKARITYMVHG